MRRKRRPVRTEQREQRTEKRQQREQRENRTENKVEVRNSHHTAHAYPLHMRIQCLKGAYVLSTSTCVLLASTLFSLFLFFCGVYDLPCLLFGREPLPSELRESGPLLLSAVYPSYLLNCQPTQQFSMCIHHRNQLTAEQSILLEKDLM